MPSLATRLAEFDARFDRRTAGSGADAIGYRVRRGTGAAVAFLPGGGGDATSWFEQALRLGGDATVLLVDRPPVSRLRDAVAGVLRVADAEGLDGLHLVGTSLGGMIAHAVTRRAPDRALSLVLGSSGLHDGERMPRLRSQRRLVRLLPAAALRAGVRRRIATLLEGAPDRELWLALSMRPYAGASVRPRLLDQQDLLIDLAAHAAELSAPGTWQGPVLVVRARDDELMPPEATARLIAAHPGCTVAELPSGGHLLAQTRPDACAAALAAFLPR